MSRYVALRYLYGEVAESCLPAGRGRKRHYVYFLKSEKDDGLYIGKTNSVERRFAEHSAGHVSSTKSRRPLILLGYDTYPTERAALEAELSWKKGFMRERLKQRFLLE